MADGPEQCRMAHLISLEPGISLLIWRSSSQLTFVSTLDLGANTSALNASIIQSMPISEVFADPLLMLRNFCSHRSPHHAGPGRPAKFENQGAACQR